MRQRERPPTPEACYRILGLPADASHSQVQAAYRRLAIKLHPDITGDDSATRGEFIRITQAYRTIAALQRLRARVKRGAGCCDRCGVVEELFLGMDRRRYCAECLLAARRRLLPLPVYQTVRCLSVIGLQTAGVLSAVRFVTSGGMGYLVASIGAIVLSMVVLGFFVFSVDRIDA